MQLSRTTEHLIIQLTSWERVWAIHLGPTITIPLQQILSVTTQVPPTTWLELRAPGTFLPGVIKAGTYYTERGREFWYVRSTEPGLCLDLSPVAYYKRIVLTVDQNRAWADRINPNR
jgi:hypothetical protein